MSGCAPRPLPDRVRAWVKDHAPHPVVDVTPAGGGITETKWVVRLATGEPLVVRWSEPAVWGDVGAEHVRREALACRLLAGSALPVPELVADDLDGTATGGPAILLTWRPGRVRLDPLDPSAVDALARVAVSVHEQQVGVPERPPTFGFRGPAEPQVPGWARRPALWRRAVERWAAGPPPTPYGLLHRDLHLGNVVWQGDAVSGLVDWAETSWGPPDLDVAHLCSDFAMLHDPAQAATFRTAYARQGGRLDPDPDAACFWQVADVIGFLPDPAHILPGMATVRPDLSPDDVRHGLEDLLALTLDG